MSNWCENCEASAKREAALRAEVERKDKALRFVQDNCTLYGPADRARELIAAALTGESKDKCKNPECNGDGTFRDASKPMGEQWRECPDCKEGELCLTRRKSPTRIHCHYCSHEFKVTDLP